MALINCPECKTEVSTESAACPKCGYPIKRQSIQLKRNLSRTAAGLIALFFGGIGINYFYLGKPVIGIFCVLFCWTFVPAIVGVIQGIYLLAISDERFQIEYCQ